MTPNSEENLRFSSTNSGSNVTRSAQSALEPSTDLQVSEHSDPGTPRSVYPRFRPFNPHGELRISHRDLPHWRQPGATYFVTFRQEDSIPKAVVAEWQDIRDRWLNARGIQWDWRHSDPTRFSQAYRAIPREQRRTFERRQARILHEKLNRCHGTCVLRQPAPRQVVAESLAHFHGSRLWLGDFVIMPNHVHGLIQPFDGWELGTLIGSIKRWTSRLIRQAPKQTVTDPPAAAGMPKARHFWQSESYDRIVRDVGELMAFRRYMVLDPIKSHVREGEFTYHSANWLGPLEMEN